MHASKEYLERKFINAKVFKESKILYHQNVSTNQSQNNKRS